MGGMTMDMSTFNTGIYRVSVSTKSGIASQTVLLVR